VTISTETLRETSAAHSPLNLDFSKLADLRYQPPRPRKPQEQPIALIGCGSITRSHLAAYRHAGFSVQGFYDVFPEAARQRRDEFFPQAKVYACYEEVLADRQIRILDIATPPEVRFDLMKRGLRAGKHILSQKPFVLDLDHADELIALSKEQGLKLAVNQNGRWAPHWSFAREAIASGAVGQVSSVFMNYSWNSDFILQQGSSLAGLAYGLLYDYAIHLFDILSCFAGDRHPRQVYAALCDPSSPLTRDFRLGQCMVEYDDLQASLAFNASNPYGFEQATHIDATAAALLCRSPSPHTQEVRVINRKGTFMPVLQGSWSTEGFLGTMGELLLAIEEDREPTHSARNNIGTLSLCFSAILSALENRPVRPESVRRLQSLQPPEQ